MKVSRSMVAKKVASKTINSGLDKKSIKQLASYLLVSKQTSEINSFVRDITLNWAKSGKVLVSVTSAHPLSGKVRSEIKDKIHSIYPSAKKIIISEMIDPNLIGGLKIESPDSELDLSVKSKLDKFRNYINR